FHWRNRGRSAHPAGMGLHPAQPPGVIALMGVLDLNNYRLLPIFLVSLLLLVAATELGRWFGKLGGGRVEDNVPTLEGAVLGLLALMIGFTFAMALSRFEAHRDAVLDEANAIGSTALRALTAGTK